MPYDGVRHAGGGFVLRHLRGLRASFDVTTLVPPTDYAVPVASLSPPELNLRVLGRPRRHSAGADGVERTRKVLAGVSPGAVAARRFIRDPRFREAALRADLVELQWSEMLVTLRRLRKIRPDVPVVCVCHDVLTQALQRKGDVAPPHRRLFYRIAAWRARKAERRLLQMCTAAMVFSEKDRGLLLALGVTRPIYVIDPDLVAPERPADADDRTVVFVGAMDRRENFEAVLEFLDDAWPQVKTQVPDAKLLVVGADPPEFLTARATSDVTITGAVEDLDAYYARASVFIAPLRLGAGLKFKVPQAMLYGLPVVTTSVGAEGILDDAGPEVFAAVADTMPAFADAVSHALLAPAASRAVGQQARAWALSRFNFDASTDSIAKLYLRFIEEARASGPADR